MTNWSLGFGHWSLLAREAVEVLFPLSCIGCGRYERGTLCTDCVAGIHPARPACVVCDGLTVTGSTCYRHRPDTPLAGVLAVGMYHHPVLQGAVKALKFRGGRGLAPPLGALLARRVAATFNSPLSTLSSTALVPIPLHPRRERERGFNQARLLAEAVAARTGLPVADLLIRTRATSAQTSIMENLEARARNVAGAFKASFPPPVSSLQRAILIDDVLTTGATLVSAAEVLRAAGVPEVWAAVIARRGVKLTAGSRPL